MPSKNSSPSFGFLIDEPSPFEPLATWRAFLTRMRELPQDDLAVQAAIELAEEVISERTPQV